MGAAPAIQSDPALVMTSLSEIGVVIPWQASSIVVPFGLI